MKKLLWILAALICTAGGLGACFLGLMFAHTFPLGGIACVILEFSLFVLAFLAMARAELV